MSPPLCGNRGSGGSAPQQWQWWQCPRVKMAPKRPLVKKEQENRKKKNEQKHKKEKKAMLGKFAAGYVAWSKEQLRMQAWAIWVLETDFSGDHVLLTQP